MQEEQDKEFTSHGQAGFSHLQGSRTPSQVMVTQEDRCHHCECDRVALVGGHLRPRQGQPTPPRLNQNKQKSHKAEDKDIHGKLNRKIFFLVHYKCDSDEQV